MPRPKRWLQCFCRAGRSKSFGGARRLSSTLSKIGPAKSAAALATCTRADLAGPGGRADLVRRIDTLLGFMSPEDKGRAA